MMIALSSVTICVVWW